jgi:hypothetical protein
MRRFLIRTAVQLTQIGHVMRRTDAIVGVIALAVGAYALKGALALDYFFNGAPGPGFLPRYLSLLLLLLGGAQLVQAALPRRVQAERVDHQQDSADATVATAGLTPRRYLRVAGLVAGWIVCVALINRLGFLITMVLLVLYLNFVIDGRRGWRPILLAVLMPTAIYLAFSRFLQIQLPAGPLGF